MTLVTATMLGAELGVRFDADSATWLDSQKIPAIQVELEQALNRPIEATQVLAERHLQSLDDPGNVLTTIDAQLHLYKTPVISVEEVRVEGTPADPTTYIVWLWGIEFITLVGTAIPVAIEVDYHAGFTDPSALGAMQSVMIARLAREYNQRARRIAQREAGATGVESMSVEGTSIKWGDEFATTRQGQIIGFLDVELKLLQRYVRRTIR